MSNLKLPALDFDSLDRLITDRAGHPAYISKTVAYATTVERVNIGAEDYFLVKHHGSSIASITPTRVQVTCAGWSSRTTVTRVSAVLQDNGTGWSCGIKNGEAEYRAYPDGDNPAKAVRVPVPYDRVTTFYVDEFYRGNSPRSVAHRVMQDNHYGL
jgi:hypothetical protein